MQGKYAIAIEIGFVWFGQLRRQLDDTVWLEGGDFEYKESKGWLSKTFYCKGDKSVIDSLYRQFRGFASKPRKIV